MRGTKVEMKPGVWRLRVYIGRNAKGNPIQASQTVHGGSREADRALRKMIDKVQRSRTPERGATVARLLDAWMANRKRATPLTLAGDQGYIDRRIVPELGHVRIDRLTSRDLDRAYQRWTDDGLADSTVSKLHSILSAALHQAVKWEWVDRAVTELATPPGRGRGTVQRSIGIAELARLIGRARADGNDTLAMAVTLGAVTGARRGELLALRWSDLDGETLTIARSVSMLEKGELREGETKTHQVRRLFLDDRTLATLGWWRQRQEKLAADVGVPLTRNPHVLASPEHPRGDRPVLPATLSHQFLKLARALKMPYHFHELRHFAATTMISAGIDPRMAATRLGHARPNITLDIYAHAVEAVDRRAADILGAALPVLSYPPSVEGGVDDDLE